MATGSALYGGGLLTALVVDGLVGNEQKAAEQDLQTAKNDLAEANRRWSAALKNIGMNPNDESFQRWLEEMAEEARKETGSADEEGVPTKGLGKSSSRQ